MAETITPDLCVIGAGAGGLSIVAAAAAMGVSTVLIERGEMGGGSLNTGCVPSKALIAAARAAHDAREAGRFGVEVGAPKVSMAAVRAHIRGVIAQIAPKDSAERFRAMNVRVIRAAARFIAPDRLEAGGVIVRARRFVLATGSRPHIPPIPGLDQIRYLTNENLFDLDELPSRLAIVGAGPVGVEMAQAFRRLGAEVVLIEAGRALALEDRELATPALDALQREGVALREGAKDLRMAANGGARIFLETPQGQEHLGQEHLGQEHIGQEHIDCSHVLIAAGRRPCVHGMGLEQAGIAFVDAGVKVKADLRTTNRRVYAVGDVAGAQYTHAANHHASIVLRAALLRLPARVDPALIPRVTYTDPEIAVAGLTEEQARERHKRVEILRWPFAENDRARAERRSEGLIKVVALPSGRILGAGIVADGAGELIAPWQLAIARGLKLGDMAGVPLPYPTRSDVSRRAAMLHYVAQARSPMLHRVLGFLRRFG